MFLKNKGQELQPRTINVWNRYDFAMSGLGENIKFPGVVKHFIQCIKWSGQRITRGFSDADAWNIDGYLQKLIPSMLQHLKDNRMGSPGFLGENYVNTEGIVVNDTCHAEWDKILDRMIFLWHESDETMCSKKNPYEKEYMEALAEFDNRFGILGEGLLTEREKAEAKVHHATRAHFMDELPEYKEIHDKYMEEEKKLEKYRSDCKDEALDMLKEYFYSLWD